MSWLTTFAEQAAETDQFRKHTDHQLLLASGLFGEAGSVLSELKKMEREGTAYPGYRNRLNEEIGDFLWYFVRLVAEVEPALLEELSIPGGSNKEKALTGPRLSVNLGAAVGKVLQSFSPGLVAELRDALISVWLTLEAVAVRFEIQLEQAATANLAKISSRWPRKRVYHPLFDNVFLPEEQLPRRLTMEFLERKRGTRIEVLLRANGLNIGDRLTDNISDPDGYRFHDIFHLSYAVFVGWSPVTRALFQCKRKSRPEVDEAQDGARAMILEEAISAVVFGRAKNMKLFEGVTHVEYDLLKSVQEFVRGYEADSIPAWQWEIAILEGFRVFRHLCENKGGFVSWDLDEHWMRFTKSAGDLPAPRV